MSLILAFKAPHLLFLALLYLPPVMLTFDQQTFSLRFIHCIILSPLFPS
uniref:Uncharacterized protein n=1 Tax=Arundo donax TaxID=35708 RepID=A0A0A8YRX3_ARUDO